MPYSIRSSLDICRRNFIKFKIYDIGSLPWSWFCYRFQIKHSCMITRQFKWVFRAWFRFWRRHHALQIFVNTKDVRWQSTATAGCIEVRSPVQRSWLLEKKQTSECSSGISCIEVIHKFNLLTSYYYVLLISFHLLLVAEMGQTSNPS